MRRSDFNVVVAVLTYKRPELLIRFLEGFAQLTVPRDVSVTLLIVDNDWDASSHSVAERFRSRIAILDYVVESERGIPVARNRAMAEAERLGADALCFIDDDEIPERQWLEALVRTFRQTGAQLVGGPVRVRPADPSLPPWKRLINRSLRKRALRKERRTARHAVRGRNFTVVTNNWIGDIAWFTAHDIRFDSGRYRYSGGSDADFFRRARQAGCLVAWSPDAIVSETVLPDRLSLSYQLKRGRDQSINHFHMKHDRITPGLVLRSTSIAILRMGLGALLLVVPVHGLASPVIAVRSIGWSLGRFAALRGRRSDHYR